MLSQNHQTLIELVQDINTKSNCLAINFNDYDESHLLNMMFVILLSHKGVFSTGNFSKIQGELRKVLKLRSQDKLFEHKVSEIKLSSDDTVVKVRRGVSIIVFNFGETEQIF
jgi:hypothetical protein